MLFPSMIPSKAKHNMPHFCRIWSKVKDGEIGPEFKKAQYVHVTPLPNIVKRERWHDMEHSCKQMNLNAEEDTICNALLYMVLS